MIVFVLTWFIVGLITNLICIIATGKVYWLAIMLIFCFGYFSPLFIFNYSKYSHFSKLFSRITSIKALPKVLSVPIPV